jgi:hypothetical protein
MTDTTCELLAKITAATGLSRIIAAGAVLRCCGREGINPQRLAHRDLAALLPRLEEVLRIYLCPGDVATAMTRLRMLAESK